MNPTVADYSRLPSGLASAKPKPQFTAHCLLLQAANRVQQISLVEKIVDHERPDMSNRSWSKNRKPTYLY